MTQLTLNPRTVIRTMRELKRQGVRTSSMNAAALKFIMDHELMEQSLWPATTIRITVAGYTYISENEQ